MINYNILDKDISFMYSEIGNTGGVRALKMYFVRKSVETTLPIEISFVMIDEKIHAYAKQSQTGYLEETESMYYYNSDISFEKSSIFELLMSIEENSGSSEPISTEDFEDIFGIDISGVSGINGMILDRIFHVDKYDIPEKSSYYDGYYIVLTDAATRSAKVGFMVAEIKPYSLTDYMNELNEYGKTRVLSEVTVRRNSFSTFIKNTSRFRVELKYETYRYDKINIGGVDESYSYAPEKEHILFLEPGEEIEIRNKKVQTTSEYDLFTNPINPSVGVFGTRSVEATRNSSYIKELPIKIEMLSILPRVSVFEPDRYIMVSSPHDVIINHESFQKAIFDKNVSFDNEEIHGPLGFIKIVDSEKVKEIINDGGALNIIKKASVIFKTTLKRDVNSLSEDYFNFYLDYMTGNSNIKVVDIQKRFVYNDTISTPQMSMFIRFAVYGNMNEIMNNSQHLEYVDNVKTVACKKDRDALIKKMIGTDLFMSDYMKVPINSVIDTPTKKVYSGPLYKTYDGEIDDAYEMYTESLKKELDGFYMIDSELTLSSSDIASIMPSMNVYAEFQDDCVDDFVYNPKEDIESFGLEYSVEEAIKKIKEVAYAYRVEDEPVSIISVGITTDNEWYFCGEDFFRAKDVENDISTTYIDGELKTIQRESESSIRPVYDKKIFFDDIDFDDSIYGELQDMFLYTVTGFGDRQDINDNPGMKYIAEHLFDSSEKYSFSYDEIIRFKKESLFSSSIKKPVNKILMPDIFSVLMEAEDKKEYISDSNIHFVGKARRAYKIDYSSRNNNSKELAYNVGHTITTMIDTDNIKRLSSMFAGSRKSFFGVSFKYEGVVDSVDVKQERQKLVKSEYYDFALSVKSRKTGNGFVMAYDYNTKQYIIDIQGDAYIENFSLLCAVFDIFMHDNYKTLNGFKRKTLGIYGVENSNEISDIYLLSNSVKRFYKENNIYDIDVYIYDVHFELGEFNTIVEKEIQCCERTFGAVVEIINDTLKVRIDGSNEKEYSLSMISANPAEVIADGEIVIKTKKGKSFIPKMFSSDNIKRAIVTIDNEKKIFIPFGEYQKVSIYDDVEALFAITGDGLLSWKKYVFGNTTTEKLVDIKDCVDAKKTQRRINIVKYGKNITIEFE